MKYVKRVLILCLLLISCKSIETSYKFKTPEAKEITIDKILVVGLTDNAKARDLFETKVVTLLSKKEIKAVKSLDYLRNKDTVQTKKNDFEAQDLINKGFNTILISRVTGSDERRTILQSIFKIRKMYTNFDMEIPRTYKFEKNENPRYMMYHTQTALYRICTNKEKHLIWKTVINLKKHKHINGDIRRFSKYLTRQMENDSLVLKKNGRFNRL